MPLDANRATLAKPAATGDDEMMNKSILSGALRASCAALMLTAGVACSQIPVTAAAPVAPVNGSMQAIIATIGDAACDNTQQCRTLAVGHKACGGPEQYLAYSVKRRNEAPLIALAQRYATEQKTENQRTGMISNCMLTPDPGAACIKGRCMLNHGAPGAGVER